MIGHDRRCGKGWSSEKKEGEKEGGEAEEGPHEACVREGDEGASEMQSAYERKEA